MPTEPDGERYAAFISYRHEPVGRRWATWLHRAIERCRVPKSLQRVRGAPARVGRVFRDEEELAASADLSAAIDSALIASKFLIVICTPRTPHSRWVNEEVRRFRELGRGDRILALLVEGEPRESFPPALVEIRRTAVDAAGITTETVDTVEPLAADVRNVHGEDLRSVQSQAAVRVLAAILSVPYDELVRRDARSRAGRALFAAAVAMTVAAVTAGLSVYAFGQKRLADARYLQLQAEEVETSRQRDLAERRARDVQQLLESVLTSVKEKLVHLAGSRPTVDSILEAAKEPLARMANETEGSPESWRALSILHKLVSDLRWEQFNFLASREALERSISFGRRAAMEAPSDPEISVELCRNLSNLVGTLLRLGQGLSAIEASEQSLQLGAELSRAHPESIPAQMAYAESLLVAGELEIRASRFESATGLYRNAIAFGNRVLEREPTSVRCRLQLYRGWCGLGEACLIQEKFDDAEKHYAMALRSVQEPDAGSTDILLQMAGASSNFLIGRTRQASAEASTVEGERLRLLNASLEAFENAFALTEKCATANPNDMRAQLILGNGFLALCEAHIHLGLDHEERVVDRASLLKAAGYSKLATAQVALMEGRKMLPESLRILQLQLLILEMKIAKKSERS